MLWRSLATAVFLFSMTCHASAEDPARLLSESLTLAATRREVPPLRLKDAKGREFSLRELGTNAYPGRLLLLHIWATWCVPCVQELPKLDALQARMSGKGLTVIALAEDHDGSVTVPAFMRRQGLKNLTVFLDPEALAPPRLSLRGLPASILIDPQGREMGRLEGSVDWMRDDNLAFLEIFLSNRENNP